MKSVEDIKPYGETAQGNKSDQVRDMFNNIAPAYDRMNRLMTFGNDVRWRRKCVKRVKEGNPRKVLDIAAGTGDVSIALALAGVPEVVGVDLSEGMIAVGREKVKRKNLSDKVHLTIADALALPFDDNFFDAVTIAFGVRNFENIDKGYSEIKRVLKPGGKLYVLELATPQSRLIKPFYKFYSGCLIPALGRLMSKDRRAYSYLPESIAAVPARAAMAEKMTKAGMEKAEWKDQTFGVAVLYVATKPNNECTTKKP